MTNKHKVVLDYLSNYPDIKSFLYFKEVREVPNKDNTETILKTKIIFPRLKEKGFQYNDSTFRKSIYRLDDLSFLLSISCDSQ